MVQSSLTKRSFFLRVHTFSSSFSSRQNYLTGSKFQYYTFDPSYKNRSELNYRLNTEVTKRNGVGDCIFIYSLYRRYGCGFLSKE